MEIDFVVYPFYSVSKRKERIDLLLQSLHRFLRDPLLYHSKEILGQGDNSLLFHQL